MSTEIFSNLWLLVTAIVGAIVWAIRLEGKLKYTEEKVNRLLSFEEKISEIRESLARIEGQLGIKRE